MSMVGNILGLGDRHPSNLMLDRHSGHIAHIDFGDCFEVLHSYSRSLCIVTNIPKKYPSGSLGC